MDPDMNKYDLNHRVVQHPKMSAAEWEEAYAEAWRTFYTPEHIKTVMRRAAACGMNAGKVMVMLFWFLYSFRYDKVHPLESGYFRLRHRWRSRRQREVVSRRSWWRRRSSSWCSRSSSSRGRRSSRSSSSSSSRGSSSSSSSSSISSSSRSSGVSGVVA